MTLLPQLSKGTSDVRRTPTKCPPVSRNLRFRGVDVFCTEGTVVAPDKTINDKQLG